MSASPRAIADILRCLERDPGRDISSLRLIISGGSAIPESLMDAYKNKFGVAMMQLAAASGFRLSNWRITSWAIRRCWSPRSVGVPDERWQERPLATVVVKPDAEVSAGEVRNYLPDKVIRWWLPERWTFIRARYAENAYDVIECRDL